MVDNFWLRLIVVALAHAYLAAYRLLAYLRYFQQEGYEAVRFVKWAKLRSLTDPAFWLAAASDVLITRSTPAAAGLFVAGAVVLVLAQPDPRRSGKIPLRTTWRATRVLLVSVILASAFWALMTLAYPASALRAPFVASMMVFATIPIMLIAANACLAPYEQH